MQAFFAGVEKLKGANLKGVSTIGFIRHLILEAKREGWVWWVLRILGLILKICKFCLFEKKFFFCFPVHSKIFVWVVTKYAYFFLDQKHIFAKIVGIIYQKDELFIKTTRRCSVVNV